MDTDLSMSRHTDREFRAELDALQQCLLVMGGRVEAMITRATAALIEGDTELARQTIRGDRQVNADELEADRQCLRILARRQPKASDLRFVTQALKMVTDLERIGDLTVNVCERAIDLHGQPMRPYAQQLERMGELAREMVHDALEAFVHRDEAKAHAIIVGDDEMDELYDAFFASVLQEMLADSSAVRRGVQLQAAAKYYERIGDHSTNLAEHLLFMVRGEDVRHRGKRPESDG